MKPWRLFLITFLATVSLGLLVTSQRPEPAQAAAYCAGINDCNHEDLICGVDPYCCYWASPYPCSPEYPLRKKRLAGELGTGCDVICARKYMSSCVDHCDPQ
jgi:hypothetical protein